ncbi:MAG: phosphotransferase [Myxococcales bacterium]|nr:phosphotransferase [Myxococcales bacterium]
MSANPADVLQRCQAALPSWRGLEVSDFEFADPKGFSSFTMGVRSREPRQPGAVLYRHLAGKENPMLDPADERRVYETLADAGIAANLHTYESDHRIEAFYEGRTLTRHDLKSPEILGKIGEQLAKLHALAPTVPSQPFFERLHDRWRGLARKTLVDCRAEFPAHEQAMCERLMPILDPGMRERVQRLMPDGPLTFSHNDTYHGNVMLLDSGEIRLLDFEFACLNYRVFDFANLFAETVMRHKLPEYPFFGVAAPKYDREDVAAVVRGYLAAGGEGELQTLVDDTLRMIPLSDFMYAMAALPLAVEPIQKIRFIPYALTRFERFLVSSAQ